MITDLEKVLKVEHSVADKFTEEQADRVKLFVNDDVIERLFYTLMLDYVAMEDKLYDMQVSKEDADYLRAYYSAKRKALSDIRHDMTQIAKMVSGEEETEVQSNDDPYFVTNEQAESLV